jgi:hypothetical protein
LCLTIGIPGKINQKEKNKTKRKNKTETKTGTQKRRDVVIQGDFLSPHLL